MGLAGSRSTEDRLLPRRRPRARGRSCRGARPRDMKPSNVFVGDDGRVRIGDFGLAAPHRRTRLGLGALAIDPERGDERRDACRARSPIPAPFVGTPLYMAPEQHGGVGRGCARGSVRVLSSRCTKRSIACVRSSAASRRIARAKWARKLGHAGIRRRGAARARRGVAGACHRRPADRWPSMTDLVDALERAIRAAAAGDDRGSPRLPGIVTVAALAMAATGARDERCDPIGAAVWTDARRAASPRRVEPRHRWPITSLRSTGCKPSCVATGRGAHSRAAVPAARPRERSMASSRCWRSPAVPSRISRRCSRACRKSRPVGARPSGTAHRSTNAIGPSSRASCVGLSRGEVLWRSERHHEALAIGGVGALVRGRGPRARRSPYVRAARLLVGKAFDGLDRRRGCRRGAVGCVLRGRGARAMRRPRSRRVVSSPCRRRSGVSCRKPSAGSDTPRSSTRGSSPPPCSPPGSRMRAPACTCSRTSWSARWRSSAPQPLPARSRSARPGSRSRRTSPRCCGGWARPKRPSSCGETHSSSSSGGSAPTRRHPLQVRLDLVHSFAPQSGRIDEADAYLVDAEALIERWTEPTHRYRILAADQGAEILIARGDPGRAVELFDAAGTSSTRRSPPTTCGGCHGSTTSHSPIS